jgi:hypothetical protein
MSLVDTRWLWLSFALLIVGGLLLPAYGPLISSSYAELLPEHDHVMLAGTPSHSHAYEEPGSPGETDVLAVPGAIADGAIAVVVAAGAALLALRAYLPSLVGLRRIVAAKTLALLGGIAVAPIAPPPKPLLSIS